jgi:putative transposase
MDSNHCWQALRYIEQNPVRAGLVGDAAEYLYSSARAHTGLDCPADMDYQSHLSLTEWAARYSAEQWREVLDTSVADEALTRRLREATRRGLPFGSNEFRRELEAEIGRDLSARPPGRPKRQTEKTNFAA